MTEGVKKFVFPALAVVIALAAYAPTLAGTFYYDDNVVFFGHQVKVLAENPMLVFSGESLYLPGLSRSLHVFFLLILYKLFGTDPLPYHIFNLLAHGATTFFVYLLLRRLTAESKASRAASLAGALVFGLHPIHTENIVFVTLGGTDLFYVFWAVPSLIFYIGFRDRKGAPGYVYLALSVITYFLAVLSKESAVTFLLAYPLTEYFLKRRGYVWAAPHLALLLIYKWGYLSATIPSSAGKAVASGNNFGTLLENMGYFARYTLLPYPQSPFIKEFGHPAPLYAALALLCVLAVAGLIGNKRTLAYCPAWFFATAAPYLFASLTPGTIAITAERYLYAPSIALSVAAAAAFAYFSERRALRRPATAALFVVLAAYGVLGVAYFRNAWADEKAFWAYAVKANPDYVSGYISLSAMFANEGRTGEAKALLREGLSKPKGMPVEYAQAAYSLASIERREGHRGTAESYYILALRYSPFEFAFIDLGFLYLEYGNAGEARKAFEAALMFPQRSPRALLGLSEASLMLGDNEGAKRYAREVIQRSRDDRLRQRALEIMESRGR